MTDDNKQTDTAQPEKIEDVTLDEVSGGPIYIKYGDIKGDIATAPNVNLPTQGFKIGIPGG